MPTIRKILGQAAPAANTTTALYTVPEDTSTVCSTLVVCNRGSSTSTIRVSVRPAADSLADKHFIYYDLACPAKDTFTATLGITLSAGDVVEVGSNTTDTSFSLFGEETS